MRLFEHGSVYACVLSSEKSDFAETLLKQDEP